MSESFRATPPDQPWCRDRTGNGSRMAHRRASAYRTDAGSATLLVGILGGLLSAAGYMVYRRLPDEQKDRINRRSGRPSSSASPRSARTSISRPPPASEPTRRPPTASWRLVGAGARRGCLVPV